MLTHDMNCEGADTRRILQNHADRIWNVACQKQVGGIGRQASPIYYFFELIYPILNLYIPFWTYISNFVLYLGLWTYILGLWT